MLHKQEPFDLTLFVGLVLATIIWIALACVSGCTVNLQIVDLSKQDLATAIIWNQAFDMHQDSPPYVAWVTQAALNCAVSEDRSHFMGFCESNGPWEIGEADPDKWGECKGGGNCDAGATWFSNPFTSQVALRNHDTFSDTSMAHEFYHVALQYRTGSSDSMHADPGFGVPYGHPPGGAVDQANAALKAEGL